MAYLCVLAYHVPVAVLDSILQWMPEDQSGFVHWIVASDDVSGMQGFDTLWSTSEHVTMCILPVVSEASDEALFNIVSAEWPAGMSSVIVLICEGKTPLGSIGELKSLIIDSTLPLGAASQLIASKLAGHVRAVSGV